MELTLKRTTLTNKSTIGELSVDGAFECFTLEDVVREHKIKHETAIPAGRYEVIINFSNRFQKQMPRLLNVPNFDGILIHSGNTAANTDGCILVGRVKMVDEIGESRLAFNALFPKLWAGMRTGKVFIDITEP